MEFGRSKARRRRRRRRRKMFSEGDSLISRSSGSHPWWYESQLQQERDESSSPTLGSVLFGELGKEVKCETIIFRNIERVTGNYQSDIAVKVVSTPLVTKDTHEGYDLQFSVSDLSGTVRTCVTNGRIRYVSTLESKIKEAPVFILSKYRAEKPKTTFNKDPFEILLDEGTEIKDYRYPRDFLNCPAFKDISVALQTMELSHIKGQVTSVYSLNNNGWEIEMADQSCQETTLTVSRKVATTFKFVVGQIVEITLVRGVKRHDKRYLVTTEGSEITMTSYGNIKSYGDSQNATKIEKISNLGALRYSSAGSYEIQSVCTILPESLTKPYCYDCTKNVCKRRMHKRPDLTKPCYYGCTNGACKRQMDKRPDGTFICPWHSYERFSILYWKIPARLHDGTDTVRVTLFDAHLSHFPTLRQIISKTWSMKQDMEIIERALENVRVRVQIKKVSDRRDSYYNLLHIYKH
ncbi:uncharacterized protein [Ptychodera flava]|uniref:uncharacterized protein n=1 Tax=Ptychodera flava TaxID=63121 RepID=UPI003969C283